VKKVFEEDEEEDVHTELLAAFLFLVGFVPEYHSCTLHEDLAVIEANT
jgi:hypothetical protein